MCMFYDEHLLVRIFVYMMESCLSGQFKTQISHYLDVLIPRDVDSAVHIFFF